MATLAEVLRGYQPPTTSALADPIKEHFRNLPATTAQNAINMNNMVQNAMPYNPQTHQFETGPTFSEFANYVPNMMGSIAKVIPAAERMLIAQKNAALPAEKGGLGLAPDNTQWQRAEAMGFNVREPMYHGTQKEFTQFNLAKHGSATDKGDFGQAVYVTTDPDIAKVYAFDTKTNNQGSQVLPLLIKEGKQYKVNGQQGMNELIEKLGGEDKWFELTNNPEAYAKAIKDLGFDSVRDRGYAQTAVYDPKNIRSKFAAFDPKKANSPDLLAGALAVPMVDEDTRKAMLEKLFNEQK
jgi:phosphoglycolate phosphatase-like HAD superfamily hydrolase